MLRSLASVAAGLATTLLLNAFVAIVLRWPDIFWSLGWQWGFAVRILVATAVGAFVASRIARRAPLFHAAIAATPALVVSYDWWRSGNSLLMVTVLALSGILGLAAGVKLAVRGGSPPLPGNGGGLTSG